MLVIWNLESNRQLAIIVHEDSKLAILGIRAIFWRVIVESRVYEFLAECATFDVADVEEAPLRDWSVKRWVLLDEVEKYR